MGEMCFNSCKTLKGEMYKLVDQNILSTNLQRAAMFGLSPEKGTCYLLPTTAATV